MRYFLILLGLVGMGEAVFLIPGFVGFSNTVGYDPADPLIILVLGLAGLLSLGIFLTGISMFFGKIFDGK